MNLDNLIGLDVNYAKSFLIENGYSNIKVINNYQDDDKCNTELVCLVKENNDEITLVCGKFFIVND